MAFKLKDLIIGLLPPTDAQAGPRPGAACARTAGDFAARVLFCGTPSPPVIVLPECARTAAAECMLTARFCARTAPVAAEAICAITAPRGEAAAGPEDLAALKEQLQQALAQVEEQEKALAEPQLPQTVAETEELEAKLREALDELRQHKESLKKKKK